MHGMLINVYVNNVLSVKLFVYLCVIVNSYVPIFIARLVWVELVVHTRAYN